jgi:D-serine deaminase-like pyridoxal phosphate-dependent protein
MQPRVLAELETPALLVDAPKLERNLEKMQRRADALGVRLRPHVKTHKCMPILRRQLALGARGITVSTLKEADTFHAQGVTEVLYAAVIAPNKLAHALRLRRAGCRLTLLVDSAEGAAALASFGRDHEHDFEVLIEIDTDGQRAGLRPDDPRLLEVAARLDGPGAELVGVMTHAGGSYGLCDAGALRAFAEQERSGCVEAARRLRAVGHACPEVSVGSTPTALSAENLAGVSELRAGVYAFMDLVMLNIGVCTRDELALSVLASVTGHQPDKRWILIDAGWMAMSRDRGTAAQAHDFGYGALCEAESGRWLPALHFREANQEHGIVEADAGIDVRRDYPVGTLLRVLPNHACATAAQFDRYVVLDGPDGAPARWERSNGW